MVSRKKPAGLQVGDFAEVQGLSGAKELNGRRGLVMKYVEESMRFGVRLEGDAETKAVRLENLRQLTDREPPSPRLRSDALTSLRKALAQQLQQAPAGSCQRAVMQTQCDYVSERLEANRQVLTDRHVSQIWTPKACSDDRNIQKSIPSSGRYSDEFQCPEPQKAFHAVCAALFAVVCGMAIAYINICPATYFVWSFLLLHFAGMLSLTDLLGDAGLLTVCWLLGLHAGVALHELLLSRAGSSLGSWPLAMFFGVVMYLQNFCAECLILPVELVTSVSLFFPMYPAYVATVALSCLEFFWEWHHFPRAKLQPIAMCIGGICMALGQTVVICACYEARRNYWASCREEGEDDETLELEIPDRAVVRGGIYRWERHPAYVGAMLWGIGCEVALCNPLMLIFVTFVLWASLLHITSEEEAALYTEFDAEYAEYAALTPCCLPVFNTFLASAAFQRQMLEHNDVDSGGDPDESEEDEFDSGQGDDANLSEDEVLPSWNGVRKGGVLWNRQFREPWVWR